jgi:hypothetical protein
MGDPIPGPEPEPKPALPNEPPVPNPEPEPIPPMKRPVPYIVSWAIACPLCAGETELSATK